MSAPKRANDINCPPCFKVRVVMRGGGLIHLLSKTEPKVEMHSNGGIAGVAMELILDTEHGDTPGFIDWRECSAITWRFAPLATE